MTTRGSVFLKIAPTFYRFADPGEL